MAYGAVNLKNISRGPNIPKVVLIINRLPKTKKGFLDKDLLCDWMTGTDIVFSIGETDSNILKRFVHGKIHDIYIPIYPIQPYSVRSEFESAMAIEPGVGTQKITVMVGGKESGYNGINVKLVVAAVGRAVKMAFDGHGQIETHLTFVGEESSEETDLKTCFEKTLEEQDIHPHLLNFHFLSSQESSNSKDTLTCMIQSSLFLCPLKKNYSVFGLEALTAALAGIPILVSENTGVAALLHDMGEDGHSVVRRRNDFHSNVNVWAEQILEKISKQSKAREEATKLRESLLRSTSIGANHFRFISTITRTYFR